MEELRWWTTHASPGRTASISHHQALSHQPCLSGKNEDDSGGHGCGNKVWRSSAGESSAEPKSLFNGMSAFRNKMVQLTGRKKRKKTTPKPLQNSEIIRTVQIVKKLPVAEINENPRCSSKNHYDRGNHWRAALKPPERISKIYF